MGDRPEAKPEIFDWRTEYGDGKALLAAIKADDDWTNQPGAIYAEHEHPYDKTLYCLKGSVIFTAEGKEYEAQAGQGLKLPKHMRHSAVVKEDVRCVEVHET